jgi:uncharacterized protein YjiS (DUF1127 family)
MFHRTSEFDAGFGLQPGTRSEAAPADVRGQTASPWRAAVRAITDMAKRVALAYRQRRNRRAQRLALDAMSDQMLRDIGITRTRFGACRSDDPLQSWSRVDRRR